MNRRSFFKFLGIGVATAAMPLNEIELCCTHKHTADLTLHSKDSKTAFNFRICKDCKAAIEKWQTTENLSSVLTPSQRIKLTIDNLNMRVKMRDKRNA